MELTDATRARVNALFEPAAQAAAAWLLEHECGTNLPGCDDADGEALERVRFAALKLSGGDPARLREAVAQAQTDWRDVLVAAGFAESTTSHLDWNP
jgi:hypothetical protein